MLLTAAAEADKLNLDISLGTWAILGAVIVAMLAFDLFVYARGHIPSVRENALWSVGWIVVALVFGEPEEALARCAAALEEGVFAQAIRPPTVPPGTSRLRVVATAAHDPNDLVRAGAVLNENIMNEMGYSEGRREVVPTGGVRQHGR